MIYKKISLLQEADREQTTTSQTEKNTEKNKRGSLYCHKKLSQIASSELLTLHVNFIEPHSKQEI